MPRWSTLFLGLMLVLSLGMGSVAHAAEASMCVEVTTSNALDHSDGDVDQVPADADKAYPHHHGGCSGHEIGAPVATCQPLALNAMGMTPSAWSNDPKAAVISAPALRPPQA